MDDEKVRRMIGRLSADEISHLKLLQIHGARDASDLGADQALIKSLEVHDLVFQRGSIVSLTYRGKMVARNL